MNANQKAARLRELASTIGYANSLGVRAAVCEDKEQAAEATRIYDEAMAEVKRLEAEPTTD